MQPLIGKSEFRKSKELSYQRFKDFVYEIQLVLKCLKQGSACFC